MRPIFGFRKLSRMFWWKQNYHDAKILYGHGTQDSLRLPPPLCDLHSLSLNPTHPTHHNDHRPQRKPFCERRNPSPGPPPSAQQPKHDRFLPDSNQASRAGTGSINRPSRRVYPNPKGTPFSSLLVESIIASYILANKIIWATLVFWMRGIGGYLKKPERKSERSSQPEEDKTGIEATRYAIQENERGRESEKRKERARTGARGGKVQNKQAMNETDLKPSWQKRRAQTLGITNRTISQSYWVLA